MSFPLAAAPPVVPATPTADSHTEPLETSTPGFLRPLDKSPDERFFTEPRFVEHIDDNAVRALSTFHSKELQAMSKRVRVSGRLWVAGQWRQRQHQELAHAP